MGQKNEQRLLYCLKPRSCYMNSGLEIIADLVISDVTEELEGTRKFYIILNKMKRNNFKQLFLFIFIFSLFEIRLGR